MIISPLAGALSDRIGPTAGDRLRARLLTPGSAGSRLGPLAASWLELTIALLVSGVGISMALPTVPTAVLSAVAPE